MTPTNIWGEICLFCIRFRREIYSNGRNLYKNRQISPTVHSFFQPTKQFLIYFLISPICLISPINPFPQTPVKREKRQNRETTIISLSCTYHRLCSAFALVYHSFLSDCCSFVVRLLSNCCSIIKRTTNIQQMHIYCTRIRPISSVHARYPDLKP